MSIKKIKIAPVDLSFSSHLSKELSISKIIAQLLVNRGISGVKEAENFLNTKLDNLGDPYSFCDMRRAVHIINRSAADKKKALIFGDYDVDGVTSVALLKSTFSKIGIDVSHYLPHRIKEGYGLHKNILEVAKRNNIGLVITADCGTSNYECIRELRRMNIEVIVTDHHEASNSHLSGASAIINPKLENSGYTYKDLAGVGVAYKLCQALMKDSLTEDLDIVSLGTIADVVPLTGENRIIAKAGLSRLSSTNKPGITALMESGGIKNKKVTAGFVSYILGPRINASGRMDTAETGLQLLMTKEKNEAVELAKLLEAYNRRRQKIEAGIIEESVALIEKEINFKEHRVIVVANEGWHQGVLGIVAAKLADRFYRPTIVISKQNELCRGSGRSIKNFHLFSAVFECREFLDAFGGHNHAVGLSIKEDKIEHFKKKINHFAKEKLALEDLLPCLEIDMALSLSDLDDSLINRLEELQPFGTGNPEPLFYTRSLKCKGDVRLLSRDTIKFWVSDGKITYPAIGFGKKHLMDTVVNADSFDLAYTPRMDSWQGRAEIILEIKEIFLPQ